MTAFPRRGRTAVKADERGITLIEVLVTLALTLLVISLVTPILVTSTTAGSTVQGTASAQGQVSLGLENLDNQISSAIQVCSVTQLTNPASGSPVTVASGFGLRVEQVMSEGTYRWEQWQVNAASGTLQEQQYVPGDAGGNWLTIATNVYNNASQLPFDVVPPPVDQAGQPADVQINLYVAEKPGPLTQKVDLTSAASAYSYPEGTNLTPGCATTSAAPTS